MDFNNFRGWVVQLNNGTIMQEGKYSWKDVPNRDIKRLTLFYDGRRWDLTDKQAYFVQNRVSMTPGVQRSMSVERRCIGYYEGATKVWYIVDEFTGKFKLESHEGV